MIGAGGPFLRTLVRRRRTEGRCRQRPRCSRCRGSWAGAGAPLTAAPLSPRQGKGLGQPVWRFDLPAWLQAEDERGEPVTRGDLAPSDLLSVAAALTLATWDVSANHGNFTLNNLIACLIATGEGSGRRVLVVAQQVGGG